MINWKNIHWNFTTETSEKWLSYGFAYESTRDWINIGLTPEDSGFANYLQENGYGVEEVLNHGNLMELRENYENNIVKKGKETNLIKYYSDKEKEEIKTIELLSNFEKDLVRRERWWKQGFSYENAQDWIRLGLGLDEQYFAAYIREKGYKNPWGIPKDVLREWRKDYQGDDEYQLNLALDLSLKIYEEQETETKIELPLK